MIPTPVDAINFSLSLEDSLDTKEFLIDWSIGRMKKWENSFSKWKEENK